MFRLTKIVLKKQKICNQLIAKNCLENYRASKSCDVVYRKISADGTLVEKKTAELISLKKKSKKK